MPTAHIRRRWLIAAALIPSLLVAIYGWDMPHLGYLKDDGAYFATAKAIAEGKGYRDVSLPGEPWQTKYPPLYPAFLSLAWLAGRTLPVAIAIASALNWLALPLFAYTVLAFFEREHFHGPGLLTLICLAYSGVADSAHSLLSDLWFAVVGLAVLRLRSRSGWILGLLTAVAYGLRSSAVALIAAIWIYLIWNRRLRDAAVFTAIVLVAVVGWTSWSARHVAPIRDYNDVFRSTYSTVLRYELPLSDVPRQVLLQSDALLMEIGRIFVPDAFGGNELNWPRRIIGLACLPALLKLPQPYMIFAVMHLALLLVWPWRPFPRLFIIVLPLLVAGLSVLVRDALERWRMSVPVTVPAALFLMALLLESLLQFNIVRVHRYLNADLLPAYEWIVDNTPDSATFVAYRDATLFLHTGRKAESIHGSVREARNNPAAPAERMLHMPDWARSRGLPYIVLGPHEYQLSPETERELKARLAHDPAIAEVHRQGEVAIYAVR